MGVTPRFGIPYPEGSDPNNVPLDVLEAVTEIDAKAAIDMQGLYADRPVAGKKGRYYWATDYQLLYRDDGSQWRELIRSIAWSTWTPEFKVNDGGGNVISSPLVNIVNPTVEDARYRLVSGGTQCEFILRVKVAFTGTFPNPFGLWVSLPVTPLKEWIVDGDAINDQTRAIAAPAYGPAFGSSTGVLIVHPLENRKWALDNYPRYVRINGVFEVALPGGGSIGDPPVEVGADWPYGAASGDLEGEWPNVTVKDAVVTEKRINELQTPDGDVSWGSNKVTNLKKGTNANDAANLENIAEAIADLEGSTATPVTVSDSAPANPSLNQLWIRPIN